MNDRQLDSRISATNGHTFENLCIGDLVVDMFAWLKQSGTMETTTKKWRCVVFSATLYNR